MKQLNFTTKVALPGRTPTTLREFLADRSRLTAVDAVAIVFSLQDTGEAIVDDAGNWLSLVEEDEK